MKRKIQLKTLYWKYAIYEYFMNKYDDLIMNADNRRSHLNELMWETDKLIIELEGKPS